MEEIDIFYSTKWDGPLVDVGMTFVRENLAILASQGMKIQASKTIYRRMRIQACQTGSPRGVEVRAIHRTLEQLQKKIEEIRGELFGADQKERAGPEQ